MRKSTDAIRFFAPPELPGVQVLRVDDAARRWRVFHETYSVCTVLAAAGEAAIAYRGRLHHAGAGNTLLMEPGELHANPRITPTASFRVLFLEPALVARAAEELGLATATPHWRCFVSAHPACLAAAARLHASLESDTTPLERESRLAACLALLLERFTESAVRPASPRNGLARCRDLLVARYAQPVLLSELAAASGMSRYHLVRAFARAYGVAPHRFQIQVRIAKARALLAAGLPPAQVALQTGFADQSHFSRHFLEGTGVTPHQYCLKLDPRRSIQDALRRNIP